MDKDKSGKLEKAEQRLLADKMVEWPLKLSLQQPFIYNLEG